ncbi:MAG: hypothetical protein IIY70_01460, partial [Oscillospiraceae bacterium]|nr:hypothetical protein [Oscillospiraceae bacterium]
MKYSIWKRSLSLFLALLMSFSAFRLRADAELGDLTIPKEFEYGDYGVSGMTLELPPGDWEDYGEEEDSDPIDYEKTLTEDFTLTKEDGSYGNVSYFTMTVSVPLALDDYLEAHETKLTSKLKGQYKNELKQAAEDLKAAQKEVKQAEESLKSGEKTINSRIQKIKKHHAGNKRWKISKNTNIKKLNSQKASLRDALAKSKGKLTKAQTNAKNLKPTTKAKLPRNGAGYKVAKGGLIALSIIVGVIGLADMYNNPEVGYKSAFLETTATYFRAGSNVFGILSWYPPFAAAALFHAIGDLILSSETMKETLNKYFPDLGFLDVLAETKNLTDRQILDFFFNLFDDSDERIQDMNMRKSAHIARILTTKSVGGVLPVGIYDIARGATASANDIHAYKPNIYLYPEAETELQVRFQHPTA